MMRQTLQPSLIASGSGRTILIAGGERGVIYNDMPWYGLTKAVKNKAQQYGVWKEVRQFAKEHPLAVPFVNADTDMIHSIAQTGWTRWMRNINGAYADSGMKLSSGGSIHMKFKAHGDFGGVCFVAGTYVAGNRYCIRTNSSNGGIWIQFAGGNVYQGDTGLNKPYDVMFAEGACEINGTQYPHSLKITDNGNNVFIHGSSGFYQCDASISFCEINGHKFIPAKVNGQYEWLDLLTGNLAEKHGSFTIDLTPNQ